MDLTISIIASETENLDNAVSNAGDFGYIMRQMY